MQLGKLFALTLVLAACGDNTQPGLEPLLPDFDVETGCKPGPVTGTRAKVVECGQELIPGRLAAGRIGDFVLENEHLRVVVRGAGEGFLMHGTSGGGIVDLARVGGEDLVKEIFVSIDLAAGAFDELVIVEAGNDGPAELVVRGPATGIDIVQAALTRELPKVIVEHRYRLAAGAKELELETKVFPAPDGEPGDLELYDAMFLGGRAPNFDSPDMIATAGTTSSYGLVYAEEIPQLIDLAGIRLIGGPDTGTRGTTRFLVVGDGSVSSVTERGWQLRGVALGEIAGTTSPNVDVVVEQAGVPVTIARADASGSFRVAAPEGEYALHAEAHGARGGAALATTGQELVVTVPEIPLGQIAISVRDDTDHPIPARVRIVPASGGDERFEWIDSTGEASFRVPAGEWQLSVSRGMEYEAFEAASVVVGGGETESFAVVLEHVVDTAGWISVDTHLHSELSPDSTFPIDERLKAVAGEGVDIAVSTDHDITVDYTQVIGELGLSGWMGSIVGNEISSLAYGHINGFPLVVDPSRTGGGGVRWRNKPPGVVFDEIHGDDPDGRIVQINHPRDGSPSGFFDSIELDPATLTANRDPEALGFPAETDLSDLRFDAIEVANSSSAGAFEDVFDDFLAMVGAGHPACATGSSDSHGASRFAGAARTFVFVGAGNDDPVIVDKASIIAAIKQRRVTVGTGAFVTAGIVRDATESLPGDTVAIGNDAQVTLHIRVQAASWQPVSAIRIYQGGAEVRTIAIDPDDAGPIRFDGNISLDAPLASTFYVVRVDMGGRGDPVLGESMPSFTNPLFVSK
jgi:hypothetical protein